MTQNIDGICRVKLVIANIIRMFITDCQGYNYKPSITESIYKNTKVWLDDLNTVVDNHG
jgi:hypothetical protein